MWIIFEIILGVAAGSIVTSLFYKDLSKELIKYAKQLDDRDNTIRRLQTSADETAPRIQKAQSLYEEMKRTMESVRDAATKELNGYKDRYNISVEKLEREYKDKIKPTFITDFVIYNKHNAQINPAHLFKVGTILSVNGNKYTVIQANEKDVTESYPLTQVGHISPSIDTQEDRIRSLQMHNDRLSNSLESARRNSLLHDRPPGYDDHGRQMTLEQLDYQRMMRARALGHGEFKIKGYEKDDADVY